MRKQLTTKAAAPGASPADRYAALLAIEGEQPRWKAFNDLDERYAVLTALGECEIYSIWKMADQAEGPCQRASAAPGVAALVELARADYAQRRGNLEESKQHVETALAASPACLPALKRKAALLAEAGDVASALSAWEAAQAAGPSCASCAIARAELTESASGIDASLPLWEQALELAPTHPATLQRYAAAQVGKDDARALAAYEKALEVKAEDFGTLMAAAELARKIGELVKAVEYAEKAAGLQPDSIDVWRLLAGLYQAREEMTGFEKALNEILRLLPEDAASHHELAKLALADSDFVRALRHYELALAGYGGEGAPPPVEGEPAQPANPEALAAVTAELQKLRQDLLIADPGPSGDANRVVGQVQRTARRVYEERLKANRALKGTVKLRVRTDKSGEVQDVEITSDTLNDARVAASLVGNLRAAKIDGGAQRLSFELSFE